MIKEIAQEHEDLRALYPQKVERMFGQFGELLAYKDSIIAQKDVEIRQYKEQLRLAQKERFGPSSEKTPVEAISEAVLEQCAEDLFNEAEATTDPNVAEPTYAQVQGHVRKKREGKREADLEGLPVRRVELELTQEQRKCLECGEDMADIGSKVCHREVEKIPAQLVVVEYHQHAYRCWKCDHESIQTQIVQAQAPQPLIEKSLASASIGADIAVEKYDNHSPLYRQEKHYQRDGFPLSRQTMANWIIQFAEILRPLYDLQVQHLLGESVLHADETPVQVIHEEGRPATSKSYMWLVRTSAYAKHRIAIYRYSVTRGLEYPQALFEKYKGYLHTDGYEVYHKLQGLIVVGCWAHARRYFDAAVKALPGKHKIKPGAKPKPVEKMLPEEMGLDYCNRLFGLETTYEQLPPQERYLKRLEQSKPIAEAFFGWCQSVQALPKSALGRAASYALNQREYLENVFLDGRMELSNNRAERSIKPFVMGRKNWLFCNTPNGARASEVFYSILETAKENGLHPYHYLKYLLEQVPGTPLSELESLLPWSPSLPEICKVPGKLRLVGDVLA